MSTSDGPLLLPGLSDQTIVLLVNAISSLVLGSKPEEVKLTQLLREDMLLASERGDVAFINKVVVPLLHSEEKVPVTISVADLSKGRVEPVYAGGESQGGSQDNFFLRTDILNKKQKETFARMFKEITQDKVDNYQKLVSSKWEMIFEDRAHQN